MTGFGQGKQSSKDVVIEVELKSVNHRFLDLNFRLPAPYTRFEPTLAEALRKWINRGHVDVTVNRRPLGQRGFSIAFNRPLFESYRELYSSLLDGNTRDACNAVVVEILRRREVLDCALEERDIKREEPLLHAAVAQAVDDLITMRVREGVKLEHHLNREIRRFSALVGAIARRLPESVDQYRERLARRLEKLKTEGVVSPERIAEEVILFAERVDITEELTRLSSHLDQWRGVLSRGEGGRKLEFLLQELGREVNTIGAKSQSPEISHAVVELKSILEKLREQVQNIE